ncbi:hypothetical protein, partial [Thiolapillus sp.]|uniref:hypothetical protein n=3 Tax=Thiolapillus sp. TaxID=2017437 RepID=UPI003AF6AABF
CSAMVTSPVDQVWPNHVARVGKGKKSKWGDDIREWTGLEFAKSQREQEKWRKLVAKLSVLPQRPSALSDR